MPSGARADGRRLGDVRDGCLGSSVEPVAAGDANAVHTGIVDDSAPLLLAHGGYGVLDTEQHAPKEKVHGVVELLHGHRFDGARGAAPSVVEEDVEVNAATVMEVDDVIDR